MQLTLPSSDQSHTLSQWVLARKRLPVGACLPGQLYYFFCTITVGALFKSSGIDEHGQRLIRIGEGESGTLYICVWISPNVHNEYVSMLGYLMSFVA
jgi:hypothetical protein